MKQHHRIIQYLMISATGLVGGGSLVIFLLFLYKGSLDGVNLGLGKPSALAFNALLCFVFFIQHSTMIRSSFKNRLRSIIPDHYHSAFYSISSGIVLLLLIILWQDSHLYIFNQQGTIRILLRFIFLSAIGLFAWSCIALGSFDFFGVGDIVANKKGTDATAMPFTVRGPYRWVRHPLYTAMLLLIWSCPDVSIDRLVFNILWTAWIIAVTPLEERDLVNRFGEDYQEYQQTIPMLFPRHFRPPKRPHCAINDIVRKHAPPP